VSTEAVVDLDAIASSVRACVAATRRGGAPAPEVMAVVKADGYGHGMVPAARAALAAGASWLGCAPVAEALALRAAGIDAPVLSWLNPPGQVFDAAVAAGVDVAASAPWAVDDLAAAARRTGRAARVHLKVDTGMARNGAHPDDWPDLVRSAAAHAAEGTVDVIGVMSHLATADVPDHPQTAVQVARFTQALEVAAALGIRPALAHLANSAATLTRPDTHFDLVRPGLACYGLSPVQGTAAAELGLSPAMTLRTDVALVKRVDEGQGVSYGHRWQAPEAMSLALVPLGYADGIRRAATGRAQVWIAGGRRPIVGTVCMDQFLAALGSDTVPPGEPVVVFGPGTGGEPTAQDWADWLDTVSYEIVTAVGPRVPRSYTGSAGVVG
jgi:alanine racemase